MGRELQKKKRRSKRQPVRQPNKTKKILNPRGNNIIAQNWNKNETLAQNYRRLGLLARLKAPAGGTEKKLATGTSAGTVNPTLAISKHDPFAISNLDKAIISEAKVERDADGKIIRILSRSHIEKANPLNDPLRALESDSEAEDADVDADAGAEYPAWGGLAEREAAEDANTTDIVRSLIEESHNPAPKMKRYQSEAEREWLQRLVDRHGDDTGAMARDLKLNPMQQTARDIGKRLKKMQEA
ncbi:related to NOP16-constituent of 66S pre-ribosomal particles, involved in 60S ribosomal subunit biogenesis [Claviceps purpurea 20.1]|uniref:Nucleolar protein 16 n=1 Tax=Claviceps purpurea (strain 20.1) TaxID=1111077 RepID=M1VUX5_CLAP2|nr:related to NOP16-constituent of 66S pre-ribosomal particles, involved in 60S ribosomal subunit biogenesis [Claviceps purpurea 20.1]